jgi:hypothetical protein
MDSHSIVGQDCSQSVGDTNHCPIPKFHLNGELDLAVSLKVDRSTEMQSIYQVMAKVAKPLT